MMLSLSPTNAAGSEKDMLTVCPRFLMFSNATMLGLHNKLFVIWVLKAFSLYLQV